MTEIISVSGFATDPINTEHTLTTPETLDGFEVGDDAAIVREGKPICLTKVVDIIERRSNGQIQLVLSDVNRRTVKPGDGIKSFQNSPSRRSVS